MKDTNDNIYVCPVCPVCKSISLINLDLDQNIITSFCKRDNYKKSELLKDYLKPENNPSKINTHKCNKCKKEKAKLFCIPCRKYCCEDCLKEHKDHPLTYNGFQIYDKCELHKKYYSDFCIDCGELFCVECQNHNEHEVKNASIDENDFEKIEKKFKKDYTTAQQNFRNNCNVMEHVIEKAEQKIKALEDALKSCKEAYNKWKEDAEQILSLIDHLFTNLKYSRTFIAKKNFDNFSVFKNESFIRSEKKTQLDHELNRLKDYCIADKLIEMPKKGNIIIDEIFIKMLKEKKLDDLKDKKPIKQNRNNCGKCAFINSFGENTLISNDNYREIKLDNRDRSDTGAKKLVSHSKQINCLIKFDNKTLISGGEDQKIIIYKNNGVNNNISFDAKIIEKAHDNVHSLIKINDECFASAGNDNIIKIWDINDLNKPIWKMQIDGKITGIFMSKSKILLCFLDQEYTETINNKSIGDSSSDNKTITTSDSFIYFYKMTKENENSNQKLTPKNYKKDENIYKDKDVMCISSNSIIEIEDNIILIGGMRVVNKFDIVNKTVLNRICFDCHEIPALYQISNNQILVGSNQFFALIDKNLNKKTLKEKVCRGKILQFTVYNEKKGFVFCTDAGEIFEYGF